MLAGIRSVWPLLAAITVLALGNGLNGSLVGLSAQQAEFGTTVTGIIMSGYPLGLILGTFLTARLVRHVGQIRVFAAFASCLSTVVLFMPIWIDPVWWFAMRVLTGLCITGLYIVCESWLNAASTNNNRGRLLAVYSILLYAAMGIGQLLLNVQDDSGFVRFIILSALFSLSLVPISLVKAEVPSVHQARKVTLGAIYRASPLAFIATILNGIGQNAFFSMGAVYGVEQRLAVSQVSVMMMLATLGLAVTQFPFGWLSDRYDRRGVLMWLSFLAAGAAGACMLSGILVPGSLIILFTLFGALSLPLYSLVLAHANDHLHPDQMLGASGKLALIYAMGAVPGPLIAGAVMKSFGAPGFMGLMIAVYGGMGLVVLWRMFRRPGVESSRGVAPVPPLSPSVGIDTRQG